MISERQFQSALDQINAAFAKINETTATLIKEIKELKAASYEAQPKKGKVV